MPGCSRPKRWEVGELYTEKAWNVFGATIADILLFTYQTPFVHNSNLDRMAFGTNKIRIIRKGEFYWRLIKQILPAAQDHPIAFAFLNSKSFSMYSTVCYGTGDGAV